MVTDDGNLTALWPGSNPLGLTELDVAAGRPLGWLDDAGTQVDTFPDPIRAFEAAVAEAVVRPPCVVLYSGGRDSSAVLAVATRVARDLGVPDPVPVTVLFTADPTAEESEWQELVIRHLGIGEWARVTVTDDLDLLGDRARRILRRHGLLWPAHVNLHDLALDHAHDGALLSGIFGDGVFTPSPVKNRVRRVVYDRRVPEPRDLLRVGLAYSPEPIRRAVWNRRMRGKEPRWLLPPAAGAVREAMAVASAAQSARWDRDVLRLRAARSTRATERSVEILAAQRNAVFRAPFGDARFLQALAASLGSRGMDSRTEAMHHVFTSDLPVAVLRRESKARFRYSYWAAQAAAFAREWDGRGFPDWVSPDGLRATWAQLVHPDLPLPAAANWAATPLQAAWAVPTRSAVED